MTPMRDRYTATATEALIAAMEVLGDAEENQVIVLTRNSEGVCGMITNLNYYTDRIGLIQAQLMWEQAQMNKTESQQ
jgi:hypothetical protein